MFKMILSAVVALGLGSVAYAADPAAGGDAMKTETPAAPAGEAAPAGDHMKKEHGKKMAKDDAKKTKKMKKEKKTEETH